MGGILAILDLGEGERIAQKKIRAAHARRNNKYEKRATARIALTNYFDIEIPAPFEFFQPFAALNRIRFGRPWLPWPRILSNAERN